MISASLLEGACADRDSVGQVRRRGYSGWTAAHGIDRPGADEAGFQGGRPSTRLAGRVDAITHQLLVDFRFRFWEVRGLRPIGTLHAVALPVADGRTQG